MKLEIAQADERDNLNQFYKNFHWSGPVEIKIDRPQDFFLPYSFISDQHLTYTLKEDQGKIQGLCSFVLKEALINGHETKVAFAKDLRVAHHRKAILTWGQHALPVMEEIKKTLDSKYFFSILNMNEAQTLNTFLRPREQKRAFPRYYMYKKFSLVSLHGRWPVERPKPEGLRLRRASEKTWDALVYYITQKSISRNLSQHWNAQQFISQFERYVGVQKEDFIIAQDSKDNIVGCALPWSSAGIQELIPMSYNLRAHNFRQFLKFGKNLGWTRTLTKPYTRLKIEAPLNFRYLLFLNADNEDIFENLLQTCFDESLENEFLVYLQTKSDLHLRRPINWISTQMEFGLYTMLFPQQKVPDFLHPKNDTPVEIDPLLVI
jgi:hypothetical protein